MFSLLLLLHPAGGPSKKKRRAGEFSGLGDGETYVWVFAVVAQDGGVEFTLLDMVLLLITL